MLVDKNYLKKIIIFQNSTILKAINNLNESGLKIVMVVDKNKKFIGIINDGDIRRSFSNGYNLNSSITYIINKKPFFVKNILDLNNFSTQKLNEFSHIPIVLLMITYS